MGQRDPEQMINQIQNQAKQIRENDEKVAFAATTQRPGRITTQGTDSIFSSDGDLRQPGEDRPIDVFAENYSEIKQGTDSETLEKLERYGLGEVLEAAGTLNFLEDDIDVEQALGTFSQYGLGSSFAENASDYDTSGEAANDLGIHPVKAETAYRELEEYGVVEDGSLTEEGRQFMEAVNQVLDLDYRE